ncbi:MAG: UTRA domain-containing protein [Candidatus Binatia bacterium]
MTLVVSAKLADRQVSTHLEIPTGSPVLLVERNYLHKKKLVLRTAGYYRRAGFKPAPASATSS